MPAAHTAENFSDVVDDARADAEDQIAAVVKVHDRRADGVLVRLEALVRENIGRIAEACLRQDLAYTPARGGEGIPICQKERLFRVVTRQQLRKPRKRARPADEHIQRGGVFFAARARLVKSLENFCNALHLVNTPF